MKSGKTGTTGAKKFVMSLKPPIISVDVLEKL